MKLLIDRSDLDFNVHLRCFFNDEKASNLNSDEEETSDSGSYNDLT